MAATVAAGDAGYGGYAPPIQLWRYLVSPITRCPEYVGVNEGKIWRCHTAERVVVRFLEVPACASAIENRGTRKPPGVDRTPGVVENLKRRAIAGEGAGDAGVPQTGEVRVNRAREDS